MNLERYIDSKLLSLNDSPTRSNRGSIYRRGTFDWMANSRGGSLRSHVIKSNSLSSNTNSSPFRVSRSSSSNSRNIDQSSRSSSTESVYHDAESGLEDETTSNNCNSIQICDSAPIASKFIDIIHYSITRDVSCSKSPINFMARFLLGKTIER